MDLKIYQVNFRSIFHARSKTFQPLKNRIQFFFNVLLSLPSMFEVIRHVRRGYNINLKMKNRFSSILKTITRHKTTFETVETRINKTL